jgi:hypothetical protein
MSWVTAGDRSFPPVLAQMWHERGYPSDLFRVRECCPPLLLRILALNCGERSTDVHGRMPLSRAVVTRLDTHLDLKSFAEFLSNTSTQ